METCSGASGLSTLWGLGCLAMRPKHLWRLVLRVVPYLLDLRPCSLKRFWKPEHVPPPLMESSEALVGTLPELPQDILQVIFATLEIPDLVRAGCVCSSWRAAYTNLRDLGQYKQSQTPCLFYTSESAADNVACLYSLVEKRVYRLTLPEPPIRSRHLIGSSNGWLVTVDERSELLLLNPITCEQIALPSVVTLEYLKPIFDGSGSIHQFELTYYTGKGVYHPPEIRTPNDIRELLFFKAFVFPNPLIGGYIVVLIHHPYYQLSFARAGDDKWTWLPPNSGYRDCMYMNGVLYALTELGDIDTFDLTGSNVTRKAIVGTLKGYISDSMYILPAPWGGLLQVWRDVDDPSWDVQDGPAIIYDPESRVWRVLNRPSGQELEDGDAPAILNHPEQEEDDGDVPEYGPTTRVEYVTKKIVVYKVDMDAKELVKINSLPHHLLFLGHNQSLCLGAEEHPQLKANHAYFTDDHMELIMAYKDYNASRDIGVINIGNHRRKEIVSKIWFDWPCPTWIVPNLTKMDLAFRK